MQVRRSPADQDRIMSEESSKPFMRPTAAGIPRRLHREIDPSPGGSVTAIGDFLALPNNRLYSNDLNFDRINPMIAWRRRPAPLPHCRRMADRDGSARQQLIKVASFRQAKQAEVERLSEV
jgi:hypothetical protein